MHGSMYGRREIVRGSKLWTIKYWILNNHIYCFSFQPTFKTACASLVVFFPNCLACCNRNKYHNKMINLELYSEILPFSVHHLISDQHNITCLHQITVGPSTQVNTVQKTSHISETHSIYFKTQLQRLTTRWQSHCPHRQWRHREAFEVNTWYPIDLLLSFMCQIPFLPPVSKGRQYLGIAK